LQHGYFAYVRKPYKQTRGIVSKNSNLIRDLVLTGPGRCGCDIVHSLGNGFNYLSRLLMYSHKVVIVFGSPWKARALKATNGTAAQKRRGLIHQIGVSNTVASITCNASKKPYSTFHDREGRYENGAEREWYFKNKFGLEIIYRNFDRKPSVRPLTRITSRLHVIT
jgi:hypothetical protein